NKTISKSLNIIEDFFKGSDIQLIRKPKIGISIIGDRETIHHLINEPVNKQLPKTKVERIQFLCFEILKNTSYFTLQQLS
ncbi:PTS sugar transporter, partial [Alkalihalophilus pseudofirmus]|nr:PTS sugar transporter [Alkalihalophilus pseudofirmus]